MALDDRDYMQRRVRRTIERERRGGVMWPPKPWLVVTAVIVLVALVLVYAF